MTTEYASHAGELLQEKVPVAIEGITNFNISVFFLRLVYFILAGKDLAAKAVELGQEYGKDALEKTEKYAGQVYEASKEKAEELYKDVKKKLDL